MKKHLKILPILAILFLAMGLLFQNCAPSKFTQVPNDKIILSPTFDHGQGYGGMLKGDYYRLIPDHKCEEIESPLAQIQWVGDKGQLIENKSNQCGAVTAELRLTDMDTSIYQSEITGYKEGIFQSLAAAPKQIPANLVEIWCRDRQDEMGIETITHYNRETESAVNRTYYSKSVDGQFQHQEISDFAVSRVVSVNELLISDNQEFELKVFRDQPAVQPGLFKGQLKANIDGQKISRETYCRLGGSVDPKVWPSRQIVDFNIQSFQASPDRSKLVFTSSIGTGAMNLYQADANGSNVSKLTENTLNTLVSISAQFVFSDDSKSLLYVSDPAAPKVFDLFMFNLNAPQKGPIALNTSHESILHYRLSADRKFAVYSGFHTEGATTYRWLKSTSLVDGSSYLIAKHPSIQMGLSSQHFALSNKQNKIVFIDGSSPQTMRLWSADMDGTHRRDITPSMPSSDWVLDDYQKLQIPNGDVIVLVRALAPRTVEKKLYQVDLTSTGQGEFSADLTWRQSDTNNRRGIFVQNSTDNNGQASLIDFQSHDIHSWPTTVISSSLVFASHSDSLLGLQKRSDQMLQAMEFATSDLSGYDICPEAHGDQLAIKELGPRDYLIVSAKTKNQMLGVYRSVNRQSCRLINSIPQIKPESKSILEVALAPNQSSVVVTVTYLVPSSAGEKLNQSLFYLPLNGQPPLKISTPAFQGATLAQALFLADSRTVLYTGYQLNQSERGVFQWIAPESLKSSK